MPPWKPECNPPVKSPSTEHHPAEPEVERTWWTVYTKVDQERSLAIQLQNCGVSHFLPLAPRMQSHPNGERLAHLPLFNRFLFLLASEDEVLTALATRLVTRVLPVENVDRLRHDLEQLHELIKSKVSLTVESRIAPTLGEKVCIQSGPLRGIQGTLLQRSGGNRLLVPVSEICQGVSIPIEQLSLKGNRSIAVETG